MATTWRALNRQSRHAESASGVYACRFTPFGIATTRRFSRSARASPPTSRACPRSTQSPHQGRSGSSIRAHPRGGGNPRWHTLAAPVNRAASPARAVGGLGRGVDDVDPMRPDDAGERDRPPDHARAPSQSAGRADRPRDAGARCPIHERTLGRRHDNGANRARSRPPIRSMITRLPPPIFSGGGDI